MKKILFTILACLCYLQQASASYNLPDMGSQASVTLSPAAERSIGEYYMEQIRAYGMIYYDPLIDDYLQQLTYPLRTANGTQQQFVFFMVRDPSINAFAMPGGFIGINTGLISAARSESEVASVMAHEMAHVTQRHIARSFERQQRSLLPTLAAILGSAILATQSPEAGMGALTATMAGSQQAAINFTRENEEEADRVGMDLLYNSGYDPHAMSDFFGRLWEAHRYNQFRMPEFLSTHPVSEARVADTKNRAQQYPAKAHKDSIDFMLVKARIDYTNSQNTRRVLADYKAKLASSSGADTSKQNQVLRYGYVLGLTQSADYKQALVEVKRLRQANPSNIFYRIAEAEILNKSKQSSAALKVLQDTYQLYPDSQAAALNYADELIANENYSKARDVLRRYTRAHPNHALALTMLAEAQGKSGHMIEAYQTRADILVSYGDYRGAIKQLEYALRESKGDSYSTAALKAQIKKLKAKELKREEEA